MATLAGPRSAHRSANLLVLLLGCAIFLNYVDRGAIGLAAPVMVRSLGLSPEAYGLIFSAFFWVYSPVQLFCGRLCDRYSVYVLMALGIFLWGASTLLTGFAGGFASLLILRVMLGIGESISFPGSTKIIARHVPPEQRGMANAIIAAGLALGPAVGTLGGGLILASAGWRAMFIVFGTVTFLWLIPWQSAVGRLGRAELDEAGQSVPVGSLFRKWPLWSISIAHCLGNYSFYFLLAWLPSFLVKSRGFSLTEMSLLMTLGYSVQAICALSLGRFSDWWTGTGRSEAACRRWMMVSSQVAATFAILGLALAHGAFAVGILLCIAGAATGSLSTNLYAIGQMFSGPRAAGTWMGFQNAIGNLSGVFGPILTGFIVERAGYGSAFALTAAVAAGGAIWWAVAIPKIVEVETVIWPDGSAQSRAD